MNIDSIETGARRGPAEAALQQVYHAFADWRVDRVHRSHKGEHGTEEDKSRGESSSAQTSNASSESAQESSRKGVKIDGMYDDLQISESLLETMRRIARRIVQHYFGIKVGEESDAKAERTSDGSPPVEGKPLSATVVAADGEKVRADLEVRPRDPENDPGKDKRMREEPALNSSASADELDGWKLQFSFRDARTGTEREATVTFHREETATSGESSARDPEQGSVHLREVIREGTESAGDRPSFYDPAKTVEEELGL